MARKPDRYIAIPMDIVQSDLSIGAKMLFGLIRSLSAKEGYCWAQNDSMSEQLGSSTRSVTRWLDELEDAKLIQREQGKDRKIFLVEESETDSEDEVLENNLSNIEPDSSVSECQNDTPEVSNYLDTKDNLSSRLDNLSRRKGQFVYPEVSNCLATSANLSSPFLYNNQTNNQTNNQREYNPPTPLEGGGGGNDPLEVVSVEDRTENPAEGWEEFWEEYPNKDGSHWAKAWWQKTKPDSKTRTEILDGLKQHKRQPKWLASGGAYIPTASTWLKSRDWLRPPDMTPRTNAQGGKKTSRGRRISYERTYSAEQISALFAPIREQVADVN